MEKLKPLHTHKRKSKPNITLNMVIKPQERRRKEEGKKKALQNRPKTIKKMGIRTYISIITLGISLIVQWLRICLPMQGTWVRALVWEDPTCRRATKPMGHNY